MLVSEKRVALELRIYPTFFLLDFPSVFEGPLEINFVPKLSFLPKLTFSISVNLYDEGQLALNIKELYFLKTRGIG